MTGRHWRAASHFAAQTTGKSVTVHTVLITANTQDDVWQKHRPSRQSSLPVAVMLLRSVKEHHLELIFCMPGPHWADQYF